MPVYYSVYGLQIRANCQIAGARESQDRSHNDLEIVFGPIPPWLVQAKAASSVPRFVSAGECEPGKPARVVSEFESGAFFEFHYHDDTQFVIDREGARVWAAWQDPLTLEDTVTYLLGPILGFVLRLRGITSLHASAIAVGDRAIVLLGSAGAGKSTTGAALARLGYPVLSEDVAPLQPAETGFLVLPGYPSLRLWPASVDILYGSPDALPLITPNWGKRCLDLSQPGYGFQARPLPLGAVYILGKRSAQHNAPFVDRLPAREGLTTLVANTYVNYALDARMRASEFAVLGRLMAAVPLRVVTPHSDAAYLSKLCEVIPTDFAALDSSDRYQSGATQGSVNNK